MRRAVVGVFLVGLLGCAKGGGGAAIGSAAPAAVMAPDALLSELIDEGPERFAMVGPELYRGGEPSTRDLEMLHALGVTKIVDLRRESLGDRRAERAEARRLGIEYVEYPLYGVFGVDLSFIHRILGELSSAGEGAVYVHCDDGRDRTSLVIALHRVAAEGWDPEEAWEREALDFGHRPSVLRREIELTFRDYVYEHAARQRTELGSAQRLRAASAVRMANGETVSPGPSTAAR
jgi:protein tyrosine/serine phosphatase